MYTNVLITEDHRSTKIAIEQVLKDLGVNAPQYAYQCDDALARLKNAIKEGRPFELLITDLSFVDDGRAQQLNNGAALIAAARTIQPELAILVLSAETGPAVVSHLFQKLDINGYVSKGWRDTLELKEAVEHIYKGKKYIPIEFQQAIRTKNAHDFTEYDIMIISQMARGELQKNIPAYLQQQGIKASSLRSIEQRLYHIRETFGFKTNEQLIAYCKDYRVI